MKKSPFSLLAALALAAVCMSPGGDHVGYVGHVGSPFPAMEIDGLSQTNAKSFEDFMGRTVLVVFFAYWGAPSGEHVPNLNKLHAQFQEKGFSIIGVTIDRKDKTEPWIVANGVKYAYGYDHGGKYQNQLGITSVPWALMIDPAGKVVWEGQPSHLEPSVVEKMLAGAFTTPVWEWPASAKVVRMALAKHKYGEALTEAGKLGPADLGPAIKTEIQNLITTLVQALKARFDAHDLLGAQESANELFKELDGLPEAAEAKKTQDAIKANKDAEAIIRGQKSVREIRNGKITSKKELDEAIAKLDKLAKANPGTIVVQEVIVALGELTKYILVGK